MTHLAEALAQPWTGIYVRVVACVLVYGALMHVSNMLGLSGTPWQEQPALWRVMDVVLLVFNVVTAVGLWLRQPWAVVCLVAGLVLLQFVPYTIFREHFVRVPADAATLNGLLGTEALLLAILVALVLLQR